MTRPAGKRDTYLTMWREDSSTPDAAGQLVATYTKVCDVWGEVSTPVAAPGAPRLRGSDEAWTGSHINANALRVITIPWVEGYVGATGKFTETSYRGETTTYQIAGPPTSSGGDLIYPVAEVV